MKLDILAIGVHPDDVELSCSGTLLAEIAAGKKAGILDLTRGELGSRGTAETRDAEARKAAEIMGVSVRDNLKMADGFFKNDKEHQLQIVEVLRRYRPEIVLANALEDRHPDHGRAAGLVETAAFLSGLRRVETYEAGILQEAWRPKYVFHYVQDHYMEPHFVVDISPYIEQKIRAIQAYETQFFNQNYQSDEPQTYISSPAFLESVVGRNALWGKLIGVTHAEGFLSKKMLGVETFDAFIQNKT